MKTRNSNFQKLMNYLQTFSSNGCSNSWAPDRLFPHQVSILHPVWILNKTQINYSRTAVIVWKELFWKLPTIFLEVLDISECNFFNGDLSSSCQTITSFVFYLRRKMIKKRYLGIATSPASSYINDCLQFRSPKNILDNIRLNNQSHCFAAILIVWGKFKIE